MWTEICGVSPDRISSIVMGASGRAARSLNSVGPGLVTTAPLGAMGNFLASSCSEMDVAMLVWLYENAGREDVNWRGTWISSAPSAWKVYQRICSSSSRVIDHVLP